MEGHVNTYGGMDKDTAYDSIKQNMYIDAIDIRISTDKGESQGAFTNMKGNQEIFQIRDESAVSDPFHPWTASSPEIIGYGTIRNSIILFAADDTGTKGWIYEVKYDPASREILPGYPKTVYYNDNLNFKKEWPIEALGRYENVSTQRIYWTDYNNFFRTLNIVDPDLVTFPVENVDIFPEIQYTQPILQTVAGGGELNSGMYQIAYRLITSDGKETLVSPPSNMIHITRAAEFDSIPKYVGEPEKINSGKSITITVDTTNYVGKFEKIEFLALYYESPTATPIATSIEEINITTNSTELLYTGTEGTIFDVELFTFTSKNFAFKTFKTVTQKDNYLVGANIKSSTINAQSLLEGADTFSALTARYNSSLQTPNGVGTPQDRLDNAFNADFNKDEHWEPTWHNAVNQYKYQDNGTILGGTGPNISYSFHLEPMTIDVEGQAKFHNIGGNIKYGYDNNHDLDDGYGIYPNPSFANNASPNISGLLRGYKRGETYRFGIIFYTKKGEATYVEFIGDIKFPDISEADGTPNFSGNYFPISTMPSEFPVGSFFGQIATGFNLGIKFTVDFSTCQSLLDKISGFQIVRVERKEVDKRRLCTGILSPLGYQETGNTTPNDFDFRVDGNENVVHHFNASPNITGPNLIQDSLTFFRDEQDPLANIISGPNVTIRAQHLSFYSPEISYKYSNISDIGTNLGNNPGLLITGHYSHAVLSGDYEDQRSSSSGPDALNLGNHATLYDLGVKFRRTLPVTFNSVENIRRLDNATYFDMRDSTNVSIGTKTASWSTANNGGSGATSPEMPATPSYMRNYYVNASTLNDPSGTGAGLARAGSNISALTKQYINNPLTGTAIINPATTDYFLVQGTTTHVPLQPAIQSLTNAGANFTINEAIPIADLIIPKSEVYGGSTQNALESNSFIIASPIIKTESVTTSYSPIVFGGDIFINMYSLQKAMVEFNAEFYDAGLASNTYEQPFTRTDLLVTESCVNASLHHGANTTTGVKFKIAIATSEVESEYYRQEDNNSFSNYGLLNPGETQYTMYNYNEVYSSINKKVLFFTLPENLIDTSLTNDVRAFLSDVKVNGEDIDSWTKFAINDFYDIDDHGPINKIVNFKDNVYFLQDQATGVYAINREAVTTTDDGVPTELGISQGWGKHQYFSKENGSIHQWAVAVTDRGIYFFDAIHRKIFQLGQAKTGMSNSPLSEVKGMHSYLQELGPAVFKRKEDGGDNPILSRGAHIGVDEINDEIIFTFLSSTLADLFDFKSIVFDELTGTFSTRLSITPKIWINNGNTLLTTTLDTGVSVWAHNIGNWGEFYGTQTGCELTLVINPKADINKVLRFLEFNSIVRDDDKVIDRTKTITGFKITTETQASDSIYETTPESLTRIKRRFDKWRIKLPRDVNSTSQKGRFRSTHFLLTLYFDNTYNKELIMNRLVSFYDPQIF